MNAAGVIVLVVVIILVGGAIGWVVYTRLRAQRLGLPPPSLSSYIPFLGSSSSASSFGPPQPAPGGIVGWFNDRVRAFKNRNSRTAAGAYEQSGGSRPGRRGFGPLDPDEAWDSRVGYEAEAYGAPGHYEEQELGLASPYHGDMGYGGSSYSMNLASGPAGGGMDARSRYPGYEEEEDRGRPRSRSPGLAPGGAGAKNPFDDDADPSNLSMRAVSPRPLDTATAAASAGGRAGHKDPASGDSPTERRSIFRENV